MKCLIAGGAGFIGSHLADALIDEGHEVVSIDNLLIGKVENIKHLSSNTNFTSYINDLTDYLSLDKIFSEEKFDYVFHLAANSDIQAIYAYI